MTICVRHLCFSYQLLVFSGVALMPQILQDIIYTVDCRHLVKLVAILSRIKLIEPLKSSKDFIQPISLKKPKIEIFLAIQPYG